MRRIKSWRVLMPGWRASAQRVRHGGEVVLRWLSPVLALGEALLRCWLIITLVLLVPFVLAFSSQGRQALLIATEGPGVNFLAFSLYGLAVLLVGVYAMLVLDMARSAVRP